MDIIKFSLPSDSSGNPKQSKEAILIDNYVLITGELQSEEPLLNEFYKECYERTAMEDNIKEFTDDEYADFESVIDCSDATFLAYANIDDTGDVHLYLEVESAEWGFEKTLEVPVSSKEKILLENMEEIKTLKQNTGVQKPNSENIYHIKADDSIKYMAETPNGSKAILLTETSYHDIVPRLWVQAIDDSKAETYEDRFAIIEKAEGEALEIFAQSKVIPASAAKWCQDVLSVTAMIKEEINKAASDADRIYIKTDTVQTGLELIKDDYQGDGKINFYIADVSLIDGDANLYKISERIVNYDALKQEKEHKISDLQLFYEEKIFPLRGIPYEKLTKEQIEDYQYFSDAHKDLYGYRPLTDNSNICYCAITKQEAIKHTDYENVIF